MEIAHVLFIDAVGYSKLSVNEQRTLFDRLNHVVRSTPQFRAAEASGNLIRLPTGDGMALVFYGSPEAPAQCALEISRAVNAAANLPLRMGIHSGPVSRVTDVNDRSNAAGAGINVAQRVMSCGDANHILVSKHAAEDLAEYDFWRPYLHDLGECEVKHGVKVHLVNLHGDGVGNPEPPLRCREAERMRRVAAGGRRRKLLLLLGAIALLGLALLLFLPRRLEDKRTEKAIAVLPFENFSEHGEHVHLADGVQDEILTDLAKVADLKVVSRTSTMKYHTGAPRNLREIAKELGVRHVVEGSVQCQGNRVRVTAQLIDARSDTHLWAKTYDRDLSDIFALESGLAENIVAELRTKLSPREKAAIEERPTNSLPAYELYVRAKSLIDHSVVSTGKDELEQALKLLGEAVSLDSSFAGAYFQIAHAHDQMFLRGFDHTSARLGAGDEAIKKLEQLRPDSGEAHLARAKHLYWGFLDYDGARQQLVLAQQTLPNDSVSFLLLGYIERRQGRWNESVQKMEHALELDPQNPQNVFVLQQLSKTFECLRDYSAARRTIQRALERSPKDETSRVELAMMDVAEKADTRPLRSVLETLNSEDPAAALTFAREWLLVGLYSRDLNAAAQGLRTLSADGCFVEAAPFPRRWCEGQVAKLRADQNEAARVFNEARLEVEKLVASQPENGPALSVLGVLDAAVGRSDQGLEEGRRALKLLPLSKDSINGALLMQNLALIYTLAGQSEPAMDELEKVLKVPGYLSYGELKLDPLWEPLRGHPRFEKMIASLSSK